MKRFTLSAFCVLFTVMAHASHVASADLRYEYLGPSGTNGLYKVTLTLLKACEPNNASLGTAAQVQVTSSCAANINLNLPQISLDTIGFYCSGIANSCQQNTSVYPGFERRVYSGNVTLSACSDWKFSYSLCCRNAGIANLNSASIYDNYIEATMNNTSALNTNPWFPNPSPFVATTGVLNNIPMSMVDAENDSLVVTQIQPMSNATANVPYASGFTLSQPLGAGSSLSFNAATQTLQVTPSTSGKFALALRVDEYRAGTLIGSSMRDYTLVALGGSQVLTPPAPSAATQLQQNTCPGQINNITLTFNDPTVTDSVFVTVASPTLPGFVFTTTTTAAAGTGTANISWTTPLTMNPATLPQFAFIISVRDNACPAQAFVQYALVIKTGQCITDSVWAGDANGDYTVNVYDPLAVAIAFNKTGPVRPNASTLWQAQHCPAWTDTFANGVNMKHADCNGDGTVNNNDLGAINSNWGSVHVKDVPKLKTTGVPDLYFDVAGIVFIPGATVAIPIKLGSAGSPMNNIAGLGTTVSVTGITLTSAPSITYPSSWIGTAVNTLHFARISPNNSSIAWAYSRTDQQNVSGQGTIGTLNFTIPASTPANTQLYLSFNGSMFVTKTLGEVPSTAFNEIDTVVTILGVGVSDPGNQIVDAMVIPNPSDKDAILHVQLQASSVLSTTIYDVTGRAVWNLQNPARQGAQQIALPDVAPGMYMIRLAAGNESKTIKWIQN